ncbi:hypothetical protein BH10PSE17_BH10PSE17_03520 [soil metagenome]
MSKSTDVNNPKQPVNIEGSEIRLQAAGFHGTVMRMDKPVRGEKRSRGRAPLPMDAAFAEATDDADVKLVDSLVLALAPDRKAAGSGRSKTDAAPALLVPAVKGRQYAALEIDATGAAHWIIPVVKNGGKEVAVPLSPRTESESAASQADKAPGTGRGTTTKTMRRLVRIVSWATAPVVGAAARVVAGAWESKRRPYQLLKVSADGQFTPATGPVAAAGPVLLLVHGTFSTPQAGFQGWVGSKDFAKVAARYGGRVFALAHPSLSADPAGNIDWLLAQWGSAVPKDSPIDIVCHSRGGLVARELAARAAAGKAPRVHRICQVGAPNAGTMLANGEHWIQFLDAHTTALTLLPDTNTTIALEGVLCLVKIVGTGMVGGLPGLAAMDPEGKWLKQQAQIGLGDPEWYTIGTDYRASDGRYASMLERLKKTAPDAVVDRFFKQGNDMVVPTAGCFLPGPRIKDKLPLEGADITHVSYFSSQKVRDALSSWLVG